VEIFHASGVLPLGLFGAGGSVELTHADARFQSFVCSIAKSTLELGFQKRLECLGGVVFHSICDVARNLASVFKRNFPDMFIEYIHFPQNPKASGAEAYAVSELARVRRNVEEWTGRAISSEALRRSIRAYNTSRMLMRELYELRAAEPERLTAAEAYALTRAGTLLPPEQHSKLLWLGLAEARARPAKRMDRLRVIVEGAFCEQPPMELIDTLERAGCYVVDDDLVSGWRWFRDDVPDEEDPLRALAIAYLRNSRASSVRHDPVRPREEDLARRVRALGAHAVIFTPAKFCEPALLDYVLFRRTLDREEIPHLTLEFEEKMWTFDRLRNEVETFAESLLFD
jgi:benzoyl-CoA reductase subunit C